MNFASSEDFAISRDKNDPLASYRKKFLLPVAGGTEAAYFCGNSLGLQPVSTRTFIEQELADWSAFAVEGHFNAQSPWYSYHELLTPSLAKITGALTSEVVAMNQLTSNLHMLMVSFYRPSGKRRKILCEHKAFPSDQYVIESQVRFHGLDPGKDILEVLPREGEHIIRNEDIIECIERNREDLALVLIGGVNYFTGQVFDIKAITSAAHRAGAVAGFDLAHAAGNIRLSLHDWGVDFAAWCSYKYLNSGPGSVGGAFIHERHGEDFSLPRFAGWWGHDKNTRFKMGKNFKPMKGAEGWQLSNAPVLSMAAHRAALEVFDETGMDSLLEKQTMLTAYLDFIIRESSPSLEIITPPARGSQLSVIAHGHGKALHEALLAEGVITDWREPDVIRMAPAPLYNSFYDVYRFGLALRKALGQKN